MVKPLFSPDEARSLKTFVKLIRASESMGRHMTPLFKKEGLTESQFGILEALYHLGDMCQSEIGTKILKTRGNITLVIDNLEKQNLVKRMRSSSDRRFITVSLTEKGIKQIERIFPEHAKDIHHFFSVLSDDEKTILGAMCKRLGKQ